MEKNNKDPVLLMHLKTIENLTSKFRNMHLKKFGLTTSQANVILWLANEKRNKIYQRDIEAALNLTNPTVSVLLNRLEEKNLIQRKICTEDTRARLIVLTDKARKVLDSIYENIHQAEEMLFDGLPQEDIEQLSILMTKVVENAIKSNQSQKIKRGEPSCNKSI